ncbi:MAG: glycerophosphodiester phosphodiesterase family protein [Pirellulaceae bacterium]|jgi:hypothetical protein|nr:glycerophosphodiester phosphodiesterase family protein [Pirellulaceae bacterium]MDP7016949.1 glycerophosphodiester phosphodiesterase family protein [Pirellulaceae bacterium]
MNRVLLSASLLFQIATASPCLWAESAESAEVAAARHRRVAQRRAGVHVICHRGAVEFAHENTLEAYRAAFELGADGNEIDIRATRDGVLVCFHDDMLDHLLHGYGDVSDYSWKELQRMAFRHPGRFGKHCRIPTLREVFELHRDHAGLMHLDVKRPGLVTPISRLLDEFVMWDHVVQAPADFEDPRYKPTPGKIGLYLDRSEVDANAISTALKRPGLRIIVEDPRGVALALGRELSRPSAQPVKDQIGIWARQSPTVDARSKEELISVLRDADDWDAVASGDEAESASADRILRRARAADELARRKTRSPDVLAVLEERVRRRSLHRNWRYCGLDGSAALRALVALRSPESVGVARFCLWRNDPAVAAAQNPAFKTPPSWTDWRTKTPVFGLLESARGPAVEKLCRDYLALTDDEARAIGVPQFEAAARTLLSARPGPQTVKELLSHRLSQVRGRAILFALSQSDQGWAREVLRQAAPHALQYLLDKP